MENMGFQIYVFSIVVPPPIFTDHVHTYMRRNLVIFCQRLVSIKINTLIFIIETYVNISHSTTSFSFAYYKVRKANSTLLRILKGQNNARGDFRSL